MTIETASGASGWFCGFSTVKELEPTFLNPKPLVKKKSTSFNKFLNKTFTSTLNQF
jgi:hypothetical protein